MGGVSLLLIEKTMPGVKCCVPVYGHRVHYLKNDRKQLEAKVKEMEDQLNERERIYRAKLAETDEEIRTMKFDIKRFDQ